MVSVHDARLRQENNRMIGEEVANERILPSGWVSMRRASYQLAYPTVRFSLSLNGRVLVEQPPPQSSCRPAGGGVKCAWSFVTDSLIIFLLFGNKK